MSAIPVAVSPHDCIGRRASELVRSRLAFLADAARRVQRSHGDYYLYEISGGLWEVETTFWTETLCEPGTATTYVLIRRADRVVEQIRGALALLEAEQFDDDQLEALRSHGGKWASLNSQACRNRSARRQERMLALTDQLERMGEEIDPPLFRVELCVYGAVGEREMRKDGAQQIWRARVRTPDLKGCPHRVEGSGYAEAVRLAVADHKVRCIADARQLFTGLGGERAEGEDPGIRPSDSAGPLLSGE